MKKKEVPKYEINLFESAIIAEEKRKQLIKDGIIPQYQDLRLEERHLPNKNPENQTKTHDKHINNKSPFLSILKLKTNDNVWALIFVSSTASIIVLLISYFWNRLFE
jgi:hypothetical protein